jgi:hypothetical protein
MAQQDEGLLCDAVARMLSQFPLPRPLPRLPDEYVDMACDFNFT